MAELARKLGPISSSPRHVEARCGSGRAATRTSGRSCSLNRADFAQAVVAQRGRSWVEADVRGIKSGGQESESVAAAGRKAVHRHDEAVLQRPRLRRESGSREPQSVETRTQTHQPPSVARPRRSVRALEMRATYIGSRPRPFIGREVTFRGRRSSKKPRSQERWTYARQYSVFIAFKRATRQELACAPGARCEQSTAPDGAQRHSATTSTFKDLAYAPRACSSTSPLHLRAERGRTRPAQRRALRGMHKPDDFYHASKVDNTSTWPRA